MDQHEQALPATDPSELVRDVRVHRSVYTDPAIFALEMERIFGKAWVYVGHDSQVPEPGDFITLMIGRQPVVMARHGDGNVYVLYNRCGHRGAKVCIENKGHAELFRCAYHGWTFNTDGSLDAVAMPRGYADSFDTNDPNMGMGQLPRVDSYRGFVFASLSSQGPDLATHLGHARQSIDELVDKAPDGAVDLSGGVHKYIFRGNWKLQMENTVDMYHVPFSHESTLRRDGRQFSRRRGDESGSSIATSGAAAERWEQRIAWASKETGHTYTGHQPAAEQKAEDDPVYQEYVASLEARLGREKAQEALNPKRHNTWFFPNMSLQALNPHVRIIRPLTVDRTEIWVYPVRFCGAPEAMNQDIILQLNRTHAAASLIQTDDLENFVRVQDGLATEGAAWVWFARGNDTDVPDNQGGLVNKGTVELPQRAQYAAWARYMAG
jgi:phenylpropionate dioxygenase-like ring-hydroxylating dioxygenase large terminal subunit